MMVWELGMGEGVRLLPESFERDRSEPAPSALEAAEGNVLDEAFARARAALKAAAQSSTGSLPRYWNARPSPRRNWPPSPSCHREAAP